jgi:hypothetical protein
MSRMGTELIKGGTWIVLVNSNSEPPRERWSRFMQLFDLWNQRSRRGIKLGYGLVGKTVQGSVDHLSAWDWRAAARQSQIECAS